MVHDYIIVKKYGVFISELNSIYTTSYFTILWICNRNLQGNVKFWMKPCIPLLLHEVEVVWMDSFIVQFNLEVVRRPNVWKITLSAAIFKQLILMLWPEPRFTLETRASVPTCVLLGDWKKILRAFTYFPQ